MTTKTDTDENNEKISLTNLPSSSTLTQTANIQNRYYMKSKPRQIFCIGVLLLPIVLVAFHPMGSDPAAFDDQAIADSGKCKMHNC